jgi:ABC-type multidrug transport system fused ATPase/permease subunit
MNTIKFFKKIINHLEVKKKKKLILVIFLSFSSSLAESISLAILIPFVGFFLEPNTYLFTKSIQEIFLYFEVNSKEEILTFVSISFIVIVLLSAFIKIFYIKKSNELTEDITSDFRIKIFNFLLNQDYSYYFKYGSHEIMSNLSQKTNAFTTIIFAAINILNSFLICLAVIIILIISDPLFTPIIIIFISTYFILIYKFKSVDVKKKGQDINTNQNFIINIFENAVGYLQEIIIYDLKNFFSNSFSKVSKITASSRSSIRSTSMQPKVYLETLILIIGIVFIYSMNFTTSSIESNLAFIAILAYGIQKTIPQINNIYNLTINFKSVKPTIISFLKILDSGNKRSKFEDYIASRDISFENEINLKNVCFNYDEKNENILDGINIIIKKGTKVAIKGKTGSGKTTLINIIAGLLDPTEGNLLVDDVPINKKNKKKWQENIAIVPQSIFLNDSSILENITLGFDQTKIDKDRLFEILEICDLKNFVEQLPNNIYEKVGERGVRISGGQRQRIGIARALYRDTNLIILDEPTNALDSITEAKILNSLEKKFKNKTLLFIMHSESHLKFFDYVINLNEINYKK